MFQMLNRSVAKILVIQVFLAFGALQLAGCSSREERAQSHYERGVSFLAKKEDAKARIELRNAVQLKGDMVDAWRKLTEIEERARNWQALAANLRRVIELDAKDAKARLRLARLALISGALDEALKFTNAAAEIEPNNATALALKAAILYRLKDTDAAVREAQKALDVEPGNTDAIVVLAAEKLLRGEAEAALKALESVPAANKDDLGVIFLKIRVYEKLQNLQQVELLLRRLVELQPQQSIFRTQLVRFYLAQKRPDDAEKELRAIAAANPRDSRVVMELVNFLGSTKGPDAARKELTERIAAGGSVFPYQLALAAIDFSRGNVAASTELLDKLIKTPDTPENGLRARAALAEIYLRRKDISKAESLVSEILKADNRNISGLQLRATIRIERNQFDDAVADLRSALNDQPRSPQLLTMLAVAYERSGSIELADKAFADAMKTSGYAPAVGLNYASFLQRRGLGSHLENVLTELATRNPRNIQVLTSLAQLKLARQDWVGAHEIAETVRRLGDRSNISAQIHGAAYSGQKKFDESIEALQSAFDASPSAVQPMVALVRGYLQAQKIDQAEAFLQDVLKANPANAEAHVLLGSIQLGKKNQDEALKSFQTAIKHQPKNVIGYKSLAELYLLQKKDEDAEKIIQAGLKELPDNFTLRLIHAGMLERKGDIEAAITEYESLWKLQSGSMIIANNLASLLADHRKDKESLERAYTLAAILTKSQVPQFKDTLGWILYLRGDHAAATPLLEDAAKALPNLAVVHYHLGMSYLAIGQDAKASEQLKKAMELAQNDPDLKKKIGQALKDRPG